MASPAVAEVKWEEKEGKGHKPSWEGLQPQGVQGQRQPLARHPADVSKPRIFSIKDFVTQLMCLL